jgi:hypothetical protein
MIFHENEGQPFLCEVDRFIPALDIIAYPLIRLSLVRDELQGKLPIISQVLK